MLDAGKGEIQKQLLEKELESVGIRLNKRRPNIYFKVLAALFLVLALVHGTNLQPWKLFINSIYMMYKKLHVHVITVHVIYMCVVVYT